VNQRLTGKSPANRDMKQKSIIWQISDGKRGHENQSRGLIEAIARIQPAEVITLEIETCHASWSQALLGKFPPADSLSKPDLIIGTGSRTHSTILAAGRASGASTIVIMAPPRGLAWCFSLCIIPEHDSRTGSNIVTTKGAMNLIQANEAKKSSRGLILVGGPSQHHEWNSAKLLEQIDALLAASPGTEWTATTSRRTPAETSASLIKKNCEQFKLVPCEDTDADWLPAQLSSAACAWVTEDSVSMIYEALSSGAKVGLLPVPRKKQTSRVLKGVDQLKSEKAILPFDPNDCDLANFSARPKLNEAERVAKIVAERLLSV